MKAKIEAPSYEEQLEVKANMVKWAKERLADPKTLIVDVETTGLLNKDPKTEVVQISMINAEGQIVLSALVDPQRPIPLEAQKIHKIDERAVRGCPPWPVIGQLVAGIMQGRHVVCYNSGFDVHLIMTLFERYGIEPPQFEVSCAMDAYSAYVGEWSSSKGSYKWQRLPALAYGAAHDAVVDCESTRLLMKKMAGDTSDEPDLDEISLDF